jgi:hypothetical protein
MIVNDPDEITLLFSVKMHLRSDLITDIELSLIESAKGDEIIDLYWEFKES